MIEGRRVAVVIPAKDEARHIEQVLRTLPAFVDRAVVVDDGSGDGTGELARALIGAPGVPDIELLSHPTARGVGAAIVAGYRAAVAWGADVVAVMAGDGQMDPEELGRVAGPVARGEAGYVKGNRLRDRRVVGVMPWPRLIGTAVLGALTARVVGIPLGDSQCGYTAIGREALAAIDLDDLWAGYGYPNDLLAALGRAGVQVLEVPVRAIYADEASGLHARHVGVILWLLGRAAWRRATSGP